MFLLLLERSACFGRGDKRTTVTLAAPMYRVAHKADTQLAPRLTMVCLYSEQAAAKVRPLCSTTSEQKCSAHSQVVGRVQNGPHAPLALAQRKP